ncbi:MAG: hypothetical protein JRC93_12355 [Deltaproteobacteria bacterium]|nr:hypothetical protein [Deltaproteobacteria bacterium]
MNKRDLPRFTQIMLGMADNFRDTITKEGMTMRFDMLSGYSLEQVETASRKILKYRKYSKMPPIAEFVEALDGDSKMQGLEAWGVVMGCLGGGGDGLSDEKVNEVVRRLGGWSYLKTQTYDELHWLEKRFIEHYESMDEKHIPVLIEGKLNKLLDKVGCSKEDKP